VQREVYSASGKLLDDNTWYSNYVASPTIELVGPKKKASPAAEQPTATTAIQSVH
jgi:hypothetical protein